MSARMTHFELDLPADKAARFDRALDQFVETELLFRPDIDVSINRYSIQSGVERRSVFLSSTQHMEALLRRLHMAVA